MVEWCIRQRLLLFMAVGVPAELIVSGAVGVVTKCSVLCSRRRSRWKQHGACWSTQRSPSKCLGYWSVSLHVAGRTLTGCRTAFVLDTFPLLIISMGRHTMVTAVGVNAASKGTKGNMKSVANKNIITSLVWNCLFLFLLIKCIVSGENEGCTCSSSILWPQCCTGAFHLI